MGNLSSTTMTLCVRGGAAGQFVRDLALWSPVSVWLAIGGVAVHTRILYVQYISSTWWLSYFAATLLAAVFKVKTPNPGCNPDFGLPDVSTCFMYHYLVMIAIHRQYWKEPFTWFSVLRAFLFGFGVPAVIVWSGNRSVLQVLCGALLGTLIATIAAVNLYTFWIDRFRSLESYSWIGSLLGYKDHIPPNRSISSRLCDVLEVYAKQQSEFEEQEMQQPVDTRPPLVSLQEFGINGTSSSVPKAMRPSKQQQQQQTRSSERFWRRIHFGSHELVSPDDSDSAVTATGEWIFRLLF